MTEVEPRKRHVLVPDADRHDSQFRHSISRQRLAHPQRHLPVMGGGEAIPLMREAAPGMGILLYTGADKVMLSEEATPDAIVRKGEPLTELVDQLRIVLAMAPFDVMRLTLGTLPLRDAITAFDTWTGLNVRVLYALSVTN